MTRLLPRCIMGKFPANGIKMGLVRLTSVWIKRGHFAYAKPCGKAMDKSRKLDIDHSFSTLDHPLTTLRQVKFFRKLLTKNSATAIIFFCKKSPSNRMENCLIFTCFLSNDWGSPYIYIIISVYLKKTQSKLP